MLKKIIILCLINLLSCTQLVIAQGLYSPRDKPSAWVEIDTSLIERLVDQCFSIMNYKHRIPRVHPEPDIQEYWLKDRVVICSRYSMSPESRKIFDDNGFTNSYFLSKNIQVSKEQEKQLNEIYKKIYLVIWKENLIDVLYPPPPDDFIKEFSDFSGLNEALKNQKEKVVSVRKFEENYFGSKDNLKKIEDIFYKQKLSEYGLKE
ncbi:hypothetical protein [Neisseria sp. Ec49-e6-T10]|uniref:hypothetical protein n=1 Tax=Neisseria sp. Ec49-e6-T10 TaxID=3140744 RepID=UPI003EBD6E64